MAGIRASVREQMIYEVCGYQTDMSRAMAEVGWEAVVADENWTFGSRNLFAEAANTGQAQAEKAYKPRSCCSASLYRCPSATTRARARARRSQASCIGCRALRRDRWIDGDKEALSNSSAHRYASPHGEEVGVDWALSCNYSSTGASLQRASCPHSMVEAREEVHHPGGFSKTDLASGVFGTADDTCSSFPPLLSKTSAPPTACTMVLTRRKAGKEGRIVGP